jgi:hypothetical protein
MTTDDPLLTRTWPNHRTGIFNSSNKEVKANYQESFYHINESKCTYPRAIRRWARKAYWGLPNSNHSDVTATGYGVKIYVRNKRFTNASNGFLIERNIEGSVVVTFWNQNNHIWTNSSEFIKMATHLFSKRNTNSQLWIIISLAVLLLTCLFQQSHRFVASLPTEKGATALHQADSNKTSKELPDCTWKWVRNNQGFHGIFYPRGIATYSSRSH